MTHIIKRLTKHLRSDTHIVDFPWVRFLTGINQGNMSVLIPALDPASSL